VAPFVELFARTYIALTFQTSCPWPKFDAKVKFETSDYYAVPRMHKMCEAAGMSRCTIGVSMFRDGTLLVNCGEAK